MPNETSRPTVLFANELGSGMGHIDPLVAIAKRLAGKCRTVFAVQDLASTSSAVTRALGPDVVLVEGARWLPIPERVARHGIEIVTFADAMRLFGFDEVWRLNAATDVWRDIIGREKPSLVVGDFAPSLRLATAGQVPMVSIGNGYCVMPTGRLFPPVRPWMSVVPEECVALEARIHTAVGEARARLSLPAFSSVSDLFQGDATFVCTVPKLDPYQGYRGHPTFWPFAMSKINAGPNLEERTGPDVFAYFPSTHPAFKSLLSALSQSGLTCRIYARGDDPRRIANYVKSNVSVYTSPADYAQVIPSSRLVIHHGGLSTAYACLAAGTPQLIIPAGLEQLITARALTSVVVALNLQHGNRITADEILEAVTSIRTDERFFDKAMTVAAQVARGASQDTVEVIVRACLGYLSSSV